MTEFSKSTLNDDSSVADAFRGPPSRVTAKNSDGLRVSIHADQPVLVQRMRPRGWAAFWAFMLPTATLVELSGKFHALLHIYPTHVQVDDRRWPNKMAIVPRYGISIPIYDEIGDSPIHHLHVRSTLAFLYPFVPMHVQVTLDEDVVFGQGKYEVK